MSEDRFRFYFDRKFYKDKSGYWISTLRPMIHAQRWVWICVNGEICKGMVIHHIDEDKSNNNIENLELLSRSDHMKRHWQDPKFRAERIAFLDEIRHTPKRPKKSLKENRERKVYFGKIFYKQKYGYWTHKTCNKTFLAHRWVWENHFGEITEGIDIHHIDGDKSNNEIYNLKPLSRSEHLKEHWTDEKHRPKRMEQLNKVRPIEWLKSEEGRKSVSEKGKQVWKERKSKIIKCENCDIQCEFKRWARFCSKNCYMKWRYKQALIE